MQETCDTSALAKLTLTETVLEMRCHSHVHNSLWTRAFMFYDLLQLLLLKLGGRAQVVAV